MKKFLLSLCAFAMSVASFADKQIVENSGFEAWEGNVPTAWKSTTTASSATVSQSTDAHGGQYSALVAGVVSSNKRLASKEYTLSAGTYTMKCYVKGAGQIRPGYVAVTDGKVGTYNYGDYVATTADDWTEVTYEFTLESETVVNFVLMNPKTSSYAAASDKLVDDFTVTTSDGGSTVDPTPDPNPTPTPNPTPAPSENNIFAETFTESQGAFTIDNKYLPEGSDYVWTWGGKNYGMKASSYVNKTNLPSEAWLVSPVIDLTYAKVATLTYKQAANYFKSAENFAEACSVMICEEGGDWTPLAVSSEEVGTSWSFVDVTADLSTYSDKKVQIAFVYTSSDDIAGTWEVKNFEITGDVTTGIDNVNATTTSQRIYSLDGRRLAKAVKGINIVNGKKVVIK